MHTDLFTVRLNHILLYLKEYRSSGITNSLVKAKEIAEKYRTRKQNSLLEQKKKKEKESIRLRRNR
jgi:hypothetical protein